MARVRVALEGEAQMKLKELSDRLGVAPRQVRYMISEGFVPPPTGGRAHADYGDEHVDAIRRYMRLKSLGFPPSAIRVLLRAREGVPFPIGEGVTLVVPPELIGSGTSAGPLIRKADELLRDILSTRSEGTGT